MTEHDIQAQIMQALSPYGYVERANVGKIKTDDGRFFSTGLVKGRSDLLFIRRGDGKAFFIEVKRLGGKTTPEQDRFIANMKNIGAGAGVSYSVEMFKMP